MSSPIVKKLPIDELIFDEQNENQGNKRGREFLENSLRKYGAGRSILIDKNGRIIAGNKTVEMSKLAGIKEIAVIDVGEDVLVAVRRSDLDLRKDKKAMQLAVADNRGGELNLEWDFDNLKKLDIDLGEFWTTDELDKLLDTGEKPERVVEMLFSAEQIERAIIEGFPDKTAEEFVAGVITPAMAMAQFNKLASGFATGYYISALFNPHRIETNGDLSRSKSFMSGIKTPEMKRVAAKYLTSQHDGDIHPTNFLKYSTIGWSGYGQLVAEFRPEIARDIYRKFCKRGAQVLDPCHGWGGRVIGWLSANLEGDYFGVDPSSQTNAGVKALIQFLRKSKCKSRATVLCQCFEDTKLVDKTYDFALTSPPYFDTEKYSDEDTNSFNRYKTLNEWVEGFYRPLILKTLAALKKRGTFVLNVGNKKYALSDIAKQIAESVGAKVSSLEGFDIGRPSTDADVEREETHEDFLVLNKGA